MYHYLYEQRYKFESLSGNYHSRNKSFVDELLVSLRLIVDVDADVIFPIRIGCMRSISIMMGLCNCSYMYHHLYEQLERYKFEYLPGIIIPGINNSWMSCWYQCDRLLMLMLYFPFVLDV